MADHLIAQELRILVFHAQAVVFLALIPLLQTDHHVDGLGILDALHAEQGLHVNDPDAAELNEIFGDIGSGAHQGLVAHLPDLHHVVAHQPVAPFDELQGRLALSDAAFPRNENALTEHVHQNAVDADAGSQLGL